jgi:4-hydroxy-3-methylbut-2-enyl diphosphate reductase IspH
MRIEIVDLSSITGVENNLCYGITRTNEMAAKKAEGYRTDQPLYVYFHMPSGATQEQRDRTQHTLKRRYLPMAPDVIMVDKVGAVPDGAPFIMGTRGASPQTREQAKRLETVLDTTCPYVTSQEAAARKLLDEGYELVFCGLPEYHGLPRLQGIAQLTGKQVRVAQHAADVAALPFKRSTRVGAILQTTWHMSLAKEVIAELATRFREVKVIDTSCIDSLGRVPAARKVAEQSDVVIVLDIGSVAKYLVEEIEELARERDSDSRLPKVARVHRVEGPHQLQREWFAGAETVSLIGGINVHTQALEALAARIRELAPAAA